MTAPPQSWVAPGSRSGCNQSREIHSTGRIPKIGTVAESDAWTNQPPGTGRCVSRGQRTTRALHQSTKAQTGSQPDRNGGGHREVYFAGSTNHAGTPPIAEGTNRLSAGPQRWGAPRGVFRGVNEPRGHSAYRRRPKPALSRTAGGASLLTHGQNRFQRTAIAVINCRRAISAFESDPPVITAIRRSVC